MNKTFFSAALIILIGGLTSYFITRIASVNEGFMIEKYFNNSILIFVIVLIALSVSGFVVSKINKN